MALPQRFSPISIALTLPLIRPPESHKLDYEGEVRQNDTTASMMFPFKYIISYFSKFFHLKPGDVVEIEVEGVGTLVNGVKDEVL
ncbi:fumarylacetoacetate hydrolase family protein [Colwellia sp. RE-S-Sl-9]